MGNFISSGSSGAASRAVSDAGSEAASQGASEAGCEAASQGVRTSDPATMQESDPSGNDGVDVNDAPNDNVIADVTHDATCDNVTTSSSSSSQHQPQQQQHEANDESLDRDPDSSQAGDNSVIENAAARGGQAQHPAS